MPGTLASLLIKLGLDATGVEQGVARAERSIGGLSAGAGTALRATGSLLGGGLALAAKGALEMEDRAARFQAETGASAEEARHFADSVNAAAGSSLVSMDDIAASATRIRTDLGLTGEAADGALDSFLRYERATGQGADAVLAFDDILDAWGKSVDDAASIQDVIIACTQRYGGSVTAMQDDLVAGGAAVQAFGGDLDDAVGVIDLARASGLEARDMFAGLTAAIAKVPPGTTIDELVASLAAIEDPTARARRAVELFGAKAGPKLALAIDPGVASLADFVVGTTDAAGATKDAQEALDQTVDREIPLARPR